MPAPFVPPSTPSSTPTRPAQATGTASHDTLTAEDLARQLLGETGRDDPKNIGDLPTLLSVFGEVKNYRQALGMPDVPKDAPQQIVAPGTATDLEKDDALRGCLEKHPEIHTVQPVVLTNLGKMTSSLSAASEVTTGLGLCLYQAVTDFDTQNRELSARVAQVLSLPGDTLLGPTVTVADARLILSEFVRICAQEQKNQAARAARTGGKQKAADKQLAAQQQALTQKDAVRRLKKANKDGVGLLDPTKKL